MTDDSPRTHDPSFQRIDPRLWMLISPALPVGGYSYSQGLEYAVHAGWITTADDVEQWLFDLGENLLTLQDLPLLCRLCNALEASDHTALARWNARLLASRETSELALEDSQMGAALLRLLNELEPAAIQHTPPTKIAFATAFAFVCNHWHISKPEACSAYAWVYFENQIAAAVKLVPLGQSQGQRLLLKLASRIAGITQRGMSCNDDNLGFTAPGLALASASHERLYSRTFRS